MVRRRLEPDVIGDAEERDPDEPVAEEVAREPGPVDDLVDGLLGDAEVHAHSPLLVRVVRGSWVPSLWTSVPAVLVTVAAVAAGTVAALFAEEIGSDQPLIEDMTFGRWVRYVAVGVGMAFGSPFTAVSERPEQNVSQVIAAVPLVVTLLALAVIWYGVRRRSDFHEDPLPAAIRDAVVFASGIAAIAAFGRWRDTGELRGAFGRVVRSVTTTSVAPFEALFWAFVAALVVAYVARRPPTVPLAVRGAAAGLGTGIVVSVVAMVGLAYAYAGRVDAMPMDVTTALPTAIGYGIDLGTTAFGVTSGGWAWSPFEFTTVSLWEPWMPRGYLVLFLIPMLAVAAGVGYVVRYGDVTPAEAARACTLMAAPAALLWLALALVGSVRLQLEAPPLFGNFRAGPVLWSALHVFAWFTVLGWLGGRLVLRRANLSRATDRWSLPPEAAEGPDSSGDPRR